MLPRDFQLHNFVFHETPRLYPLISDLQGNVLPACRAGLEGSVTDVSNLREFVVAFLVQTAVDLARRVGANMATRADARAAFEKHLGFNLSRHVLMRGYRKDREGRLLDEQRVPIPAGAPPFLSDQDALDSEQLLQADASGAPTRVYRRTDLEDCPDEYLRRLHGADVLALGGPVPIDWLRQQMRPGGSFPFWYELDRATPYAENKDANRYPIHGPEGSLFDPQWNSVNYGIITRADKSMFDAGTGTFVNLSGCNREGTLGAARAFNGMDRMRTTLEGIRALGVTTTQDFQAVVRVPLGEQARHEPQRVVAAVNL